MKDLVSVSFFFHPRLHEDLKIRMHYDDFRTQSEFFRACATAYVEKNDKFMQFIDSYKGDHRLQAKVSIQQSARLRERGKNLMKKLGITKEDMENIFDLIEEEIPEL